MPTVSLTYEGSLRTRLVHEKSGSPLQTDAPVDNHGKGEAFSPTDLVAAALISCMVTVMGILAESKGFDMGKVTGSVNKIMGENPRRITELDLVLNFSNPNLSQKERQMLENTAMNCPVAKSIHPEIIVQVRFNYPA